MVSIGICGQGNAPTPDDRIAGIQKQIREHLLKFAGVAKDLGNLPVVVADDFNLAASQLWLQQLQRIVEHAMYVHVRKFSRAARAGKVQKVVNDVCGTLRLAPDL